MLSGSFARERHVPPILRGYRNAQAAGDIATADSILNWLSGQPNVAAAAKRFAGAKGDIDHFGAMNFLQGVLAVLRDSGQAGLLVVLDEVETIQRVRSDVRDKSLNALRQMLDEIDAGRFPGLYLLITGTSSFFEGPQGVQRLTVAGICCQCSVALRALPDMNFSELDCRPLLEMPLHILAQQIMALALQQRGITRPSIREWLNRVPAFANVDPDILESMLRWMIDQELMWDDDGVLWFGKKGESVYGRRNFMELFTVFLVPPVFQVMHGRLHIGSVDEIAFVTRQQGPKVLLLGGSTWQVNQIEWSRRIAYVEPVKDKGEAKWLGSGRPVSARQARMIRTLLCCDEPRDFWSRRASERMGKLREQYAWVRENQTTVVLDNKGLMSWFTFAGTLANLALAPALRETLGLGVKSDSLALRFDTVESVQRITAAIETIRVLPPESLLPEIDEQAISGLKFSDCLSPVLAHRVLSARYADPESVRSCLEEAVSA